MQFFVVIVCLIFAIQVFTYVNISTQLKWLNFEAHYTQMTYISSYRGQCYSLAASFHRVWIVSLQLERVYQPELMMFVILLLICSILYALSDFLKTVVLCLKLKGPPVIPFLGNVLLLQDKNCKYYKSFIQ